MENMVAEALLDKYEKELSKCEQEIKDTMKRLEEKKYNIFEIKRKAQEVCTHPEQITTESFNYHQGYDEHKIICQVCDKVLKHY